MATPGTSAAPGGSGERLRELPHPKQSVVIATRGRTVTPTCASKPAAVLSFAPLAELGEPKQSVRRGRPESASSPRSWRSGPLASDVAWAWKGVRPEAFATPTPGSRPPMAHQELVLGQRRSSAHVATSKAPVSITARHHVGVSLSLRPNSLTLAPPTPDPLATAGVHDERQSRIANFSMHCGPGLPQQRRPGGSAAAE